MTTKTPKHVGVYRKYVFVGRTPRGHHVEIVAGDLHEIAVVAGMQNLSGIVTWHNVKVWPRCRVENGVLQ